MIISRAALRSKIVEREWQLARKQGKTVSPVIPPKRKDAIDFARLPRWMQAQHFYDLAQPEQRTNLIKTLFETGQQPKRPMMAPPLPEGFVERPGEFEQLRSALLYSRR